MKTLIAAIVVLVVGLRCPVQWWRRRRVAREIALVNAEIAARGATPRFTGWDDTLRCRTEQRRATAARMRHRANHVDAGTPVSEVLRRHVG